MKIWKICCKTMTKSGKITLKFCEDGAKVLENRRDVEYKYHLVDSKTNLRNYAWIAKIGVDAAENEPGKGYLKRMIWRTPLMITSLLEACFVDNDLMNRTISWRVALDERNPGIAEEKIEQDRKSHSIIEDGNLIFDHRQSFSPNQPDHAWTKTHKMCAIPFLLLFVSFFSFFARMLFSLFTWPDKKQMDTAHPTHCGSIEQRETVTQWMQQENNEQARAQDHDSNFDFVEDAGFRGAGGSGRARRGRR